MRRIRPAIREDPILLFARPTARPRVFSLFAALPLAALAAAAAAFAQPPVLVDHGRVPRASGPIEVDGRLVKSSSPYVAGSRVTLLKIDFDEITADEASFKRFASAGDDPKSMDASALKGIKGLQVSSEPEVVIEFTK